MKADINDPIFIRRLRSRLINGDDRIRKTRLTPSQVEEFDAEEGNIAQKSKQEEITHATLSTAYVTYLKTCIWITSNPAQIRRADSIAHIILKKYNEERPTRIIAPASYAMSILQSVTRLGDSEHKRYLARWALRTSEMLRQLANQDITLEAIAQIQAREELEKQIAQKGKKWVAKKMRLIGHGGEAKLDAILKELTDKAGFGASGYRGSVNYLDENGVFSPSKVPAINNFIRIMIEEKENYNES